MALGDRVDRWLTINEAKIIAQQGYQYGRMAPGKIDPHAAGAVIHHLNLAHGRAVTAFRTAKAKGPNRAVPATCPVLSGRPKRASGSRCRNRRRHGEHSLPRSTAEGPVP
jgi:beta-glucosidase